MVSLEITSQCNLNCSFCSAQLLKFSRPDLPTEYILEIVKKLASEGIYSIFLTGGEPFLRSDLSTIVKKCIDLRMDVSLSTSGTEVSKKAANEIAASGLEEIQVSIHAPDSTHDMMVGVQGAMERSFAGLQNLVDAGMAVTVAAVSTRANGLLLPELAEKVAKMGAKHFRMLRLMPHSHDVLQQVIPYQDMQRLVEYLILLETKLQTLNDFSIEIHTSPGYLDKATSDPREYGIVHPLCHTCSAGKLSMGILSDGDCVPCLELKDSHFSCGNILRDSLDSIWNSEPMLKLRSTTPDSYTGECGKCQIRWTCYSARCVSYNLHGDLCGDDSSCYQLS
jgi:radical SAM protein with 4Fe4S-binding SPASM domain